MMPIFTVNIGHPTVSGTKLGTLMPVNTFTNHIQIQLLTFDFHRLAYISTMTTCTSVNEIIKVHV